MYHISFQNAQAYRYKLFHLLIFKIFITKLYFRLNAYNAPNIIRNADDVNLLGDNIDAIKKNMETLIDASKEVGLQVNTEKTKYMLLSCHQNAAQNYGIKIANRCFENVAKFRYLGTNIRNQNLIQ
jgi:hypothetical protein